jgi:hypothetical protein
MTDIQSLYIIGALQGLFGVSMFLYLSLTVED